MYYRRGYVFIRVGACKYSRSQGARSLNTALSGIIFDTI